jgi:hypothetical protein
MILGESNTAKTHYAAQLYGRLEKETGAIKLRESLSDLTPFRSALENLRNGLPAEHSESGFSADAPLKLRGPAEESIDVLWPDYAGEQVKDMIDHRKITSDWKRRLSTSQAWLLFIRPNLLRDREDIFSRPIQELLKQPSKGEERGPLVWSDSARLIELLQLLLFARGVSSLYRSTTPILGIMLSCWDEIAAPAGTPSEVLKNRAPLLAAFIESRWKEKSRFVFGVAPVGKPLDKDHCDDEIIDTGPEQHGYVVLSDGRRDSDLTLPLLELLRRR